MGKYKAEEFEEEEEEEEEEELPTFPPIKGKTQIFPYFDIKKDADQILCKSTVIYGDSGDGKSYITNTLLHGLSPYIGILFIFCPTARIDKSFPMVEYTSPLFVFETLDMSKISGILTFAEHRTAMLRIIENPKKLEETVRKFILPFYKSVGEERLFNKTKKGYKRIKSLERKFDFEESTKIERDEFYGTLIKLYRILLYFCKRYLYQHKVTIPAKYKELALPVLFYDIKPYNIVLTNDFGNELCNQKKDEATISSELVIRERHYNITTIHLIQHVGMIKKCDRGQIKVNIFLSPNSISNYISTMNVKGPARKKLEEASEFILSADRNKAVRKYPAVIYFKLEEKVFYTFADSKLDIERIGNTKLYKILDNYVRDHTENNPLADIFNR